MRLSFFGPQSWSLALAVALGPRCPWPKSPAAVVAIRPSPQFSEPGWHSLTLLLGVGSYGHRISPGGRGRGLITLVAHDFSFDAPVRRLYLWPTSRSGAHGESYDSTRGPTQKGHSSVYGRTFYDTHQLEDDASMD
ncbi:hypothetical protein BC567DRAFT_66056 [Phyllosticta citribraziliensis]